MLELRKVTATLSAIGSALFLSACSDALSCSSNEAKQLVIDITKQHYGPTQPRLPRLTNWLTNMKSITI